GFRSAERSHETGCRAMVKEFAGALCSHGQGKGTKRFAVLHEFVEILLDVRCPGRREQAAIAKGSGAKFGCSVKPSDNFAAIKEPNHLVKLLFLTVMPAVAYFAVIEHLLDFLVGKGRPPVEVFHRTQPGVARA